MIVSFEKGDAHFALNVLGFEISYHDLLEELTTTMNNKSLKGGPAASPSTVSTTSYVMPNEEIIKR